MKKIVSIAITFVLIFALSVPTFAATAADAKAKIDAYAAKAGITAADVVAAKEAVDALNAATLAALNISAVEAVVKPHAAALKAGTADLAALQSAINAALPSGVTINVTSPSVDGTRLTANVSIAIHADVSATGVAVTKSVGISNNGTVAQPTPVAVANPVKATGSNVDMTNIALLGFAVIAVLGSAVVYTRKLGREV